MRQWKFEEVGVVTGLPNDGRNFGDHSRQRLSRCHCNLGQQGIGLLSIILLFLAEAKITEVGLSPPGCQLTAGYEATK